MSIMQPMLAELEHELGGLRRFIDVMPEDKLSWKPHPKSWSLGQLALHAAVTPGNVSQLTTQDSVPAPTFGHADQPGTRKEIHDALNASLGKTKEILGGMSDQRAMAEWRVMRGDKAVMALPRAALVRSILLNHLIHHRGELAVYLRLLNVPVPATYGASADENPFAA
jgi:uncharacterized damage-inducible protein DinB